MKICILTHTFPKNVNDSTSSFMHTLSLGLKKTGNEIIVLTPYCSGLEVKNFPYKVIFYKYIWPSSLHLLGYSRTLKRGSKLTTLTYFLSPFLFLFGILALFKICRKEKIDYISSHWILPNGFIAYVVSKLLKIPYSVTVCGSDVFVAKKNLIFSKMALVSANSASIIIADSPTYLNDLIQIGSKIKKNCIIPYPVDVNKFRPTREGVDILRRKLNLKKDLVILTVGRLVHKKGFEYLIESMSAIVKKYKNIKLVMVGDGDLKKYLETLVFKLNLSSNIKLVGAADRDLLLTYYNLGDIFVMPSIVDKEGNVDDQPVSLLEAMSCGRPVIATNFPGIKLTVRDGKNGILIPEKNIFLIQKALEKLLVSKDLRNKMGKESRKIILDKLSDEIIAQKYVGLFNEVI